jgi:hypothetical protein
MPYLPPELTPPLALAAAKAANRILAPTPCPAGASTNPSGIGFSTSLTVTKSGAVLYSRQSKDLTRYFPDVIAAAEEQIPPAASWTARRSSGRTAASTSTPCSNG